MRGGLWIWVGGQNGEDQKGVGGLRLENPNQNILYKKNLCSIKKRKNQYNPECCFPGEIFNRFSRALKRKE